MAENTTTDGVRLVDWPALAAGIGFGIMWATAFTSARVIVTYAPPFTALSLRFLAGGLIGIALAKALGQSWHLNRGQWRGVVIFAVFQFGGYLGLNFYAMQTVEASLAAIIASSMPLLVALAGWLLFRERLPLLGVAGLVAGMTGVALIMGTRVSGGADVFGVMLCLLAVVSLTVSTLAVRGASSGGDYLMVVGLQMMVGAAVLAVPAVTLERWEVDWSWPLIAAFVYTLLVPGLLATVTWVWLVNRIGATRAAVFHFLTPFFGVATAALLLGEAIGTWDALGVGVVAGGILAVQLAKQKRAEG
ncbi:DMT family transporter [Histidinibacterium lentulum]|uniref:DMT family transporter n=1 Tax=Histidinibacterium lentulum TaxID=2480588 RepID=A0A3N2R1J8_9RHOB|nr:DMT family transporter [Histidinibacterium lentulum]ROU01253.1 DMT family transporter [Histidinibacterium lentulum]